MAAGLAADANGAFTAELSGMDGVKPDRLALASGSPTMRPSPSLRHSAFASDATVDPARG